MKFCSNCGSAMRDDASFCPVCGTQAASSTTNMYGIDKSVLNNQASIVRREPSGAAKAAKVFMIIGCIFNGFYILPLLWCVPMTISFSKKIQNGEKVSMGFKICCLLFVNLISGILMLVDSDK